MDLLKLIILLAFMIVLIIRKIKVGYVLLLATILTEVLFYIPIEKFLIAVLKSTFTEKTFTIVVMIFSILVLSNFMQEKKILASLITNLSLIIKNRKILNICLPAFIGLLPMPGGALFSAPMVKEGLNGVKDLTNEDKTYINYWFRHIWEYILPLYPGVILTTGIFNISERSIFAAHFPFTIGMILIGYFMVYFRKDYSIEATDKKNNFTNFLKIIKDISPIIIILTLSMGLNLNVALSMIVALIFSFLLYRTTFSEIKLYLKKALNYDMLIMVIGIFYFKAAIESTGAISLLPNLFSDNSASIFIMIVLLPFITGLLTGITLAYVGIAFPIISSYIVSNTGVNMSYEMLAYVSGFIGVLLSPVHICLLLTNEYFGSDLSKVFSKYLLKSCLSLFLLLILIFYIRGTGFFNFML